MSAPRIDEDRLQAYLDGELSAEARGEVEQAAADDPALAARIARDRAILEALREAWEPVRREPVPARLLLAAGPRRWPVWGRAAAAAALLAAGTLLGWQIADRRAEHRLAAPRPVILEAAGAHAVYLPEVRHPVEVPAAESAHLNRWLSKRLGHSLEAPDLRRLGLTLVGGRLLPDAGRPAAQFMYETRAGERVTIYCRTVEGALEPTALHFAADRGFEVVWWDEDHMSYAVTGRLPRERMTAVAMAVQAQL